jgi:hypothetical protein
MSASISKDLQRENDNFHAQALSIVNDFANTLEVQPVPTRLYHYTNGKGLRGILESGKFWLTDIFYLNDPSELRHGLKSAIRFIEQEAKGGSKEVKILSNRINLMLDSGIENLGHYFICCFSRAGDDLGQWRAYADDGRGYTLGFDGKLLDDAFVKPAGKPIMGRMTFPVTYNEAPLRDIHRRIVEALFPLVSRLGLPSVSTEILLYMHELSLSALAPILQAAMFFKHMAYENEAEYRLFELHPAGPVSDLKFRERPYSLVRYREFDWRAAAPDALKTITVGPAADRDTATRFANDCRRAFHSSPEVKILYSDIPYRVA